MKKIILFLILSLIPLNISANELIEVKLYKCVDGDTAWFLLNNEKIKTRFLAIDTPESTNKIEVYGKEASDFTCNHLTSASKIEIEYDNNSDKFDKYNRHLVWIFVDNELLQDLIIKNGFADIKYIYGDYKYLNQLEISLKEAKNNKLNIWSNNDYLFNLLGYEVSKEFLLSIIFLVIITLLGFKNKKLTRILKKYFKKLF